MTEIELKYGCNPHQSPAGLSVPAGSGFRVLSGRPSYINILDALGAWQLVRELKVATGKPAAASFKHTSPAGAAVSGLLSDAYRASQFLAAGDLSPVASAYVRARGGDRMCSFDDVAAVSEVVDLSLARVLFDEVSDLIIAPGFEPDALELLRSKRHGGYLVLHIDPAFEPPETESREVFGFRLRQQRNTAQISKALLERVVTTGAPVSPQVLETLTVATIALKYTQSNSVCLAFEGQVVGMGAGQQSRVHCTRLACDKADKWLLQQHPKTLDLRFKDGLPKPEKANVVGVRRHLPVVRCLHPVCRQPRSRRQEQRAVRRPGRGIGSRRRGDHGRPPVRHDHDPHRTAAVPALAGRRSSGGEGSRAGRCAGGGGPARQRRASPVPSLPGAAAAAPATTWAAAVGGQDRPGRHEAAGAPC